MMIPLTNTPNLDIYGIMVRDRDIRTLCLCGFCEGIIAEAAERMDTGGVRADYDDKFFRLWRCYGRTSRVLFAYNDNMPDPSCWTPSGRGGY